MKESFGGTWLFQIVILFVILFTGYLCLSINHSKAFNVKNDIVTVVERHGNIDRLELDSQADFESEIAAVFEKERYRITGRCENSDDWEGYDNQGKKTGNETGNAFCLKQVTNGNCVTKITCSPGDSCANQRCTYYYQVKTFYQLDVPILKLIFNLEIKGDTTANYINKY